MKKHVWKYCLERSITISITDKEILSKYAHKDALVYNGWFTMVIRRNYINIIIKEGYAWDGCSPKFVVNGILVGIWDGPYSDYTHKPQTYYASLVHDILCQFKDSHPIQRADIDRIFYFLMKRDKFLLAPIYYAAVRLFVLLFRS